MMPSVHSWRCSQRRSEQPVAITQTWKSSNTRGHCRSVRPVCRHSCKRSRWCTAQGQRNSGLDEALSIHSNEWLLEYGLLTEYTPAIQLEHAKPHMAANSQSQSSTQLKRHTHTQMLVR